MDDKKYVVVTNAKREVLDSSSEIGKKTINYRKGELGVLLPEIIFFYSDANKEKRQRHQIFLHMFPGDIKPSDTNFPILMFEPDFNRYLIMILEKNEFKTINGTSIEAVLKGVQKIRKSIGMNLDLDTPQGRYDTGKIIVVDRNPQKTFLETQWKYLEVFSTLYGDRIFDVPFDNMRKKISKETIEWEKEDMLRRGNKKWGGIDGTINNSIMKMVVS